MSQPVNPMRIYAAFIFTDDFVYMSEITSYYGQAKVHVLKYLNLQNNMMGQNTNNSNTQPKELTNEDLFLRMIVDKTSLYSNIVCWCR